MLCQCVVGDQFTTAKFFLRSCGAPDCDSRTRRLAGRRGMRTAHPGARLPMPEAHESPRAYAAARRAAGSAATSRRLSRTAEARGGYT